MLDISTSPVLSTTLDTYTTLLSGCLVAMAVYILITNYLYKKLLRTLKRANIFIAFYHLENETFSYITKRKPQLRFRGLVFKTFQDFMGQFIDAEHDGIKLAFASLTSQAKPISIDLTTKLGNRSFRLSAHGFRGHSKWAIILLHDITKQEQEKTALRLECKMLTTSLSNYKSVFDHLPMPIWIRQDHEILYWNPACAALFHSLSSAEPHPSYHRLSVSQVTDLMKQSHIPKAFIVGGNRRSFTFHEHKTDRSLTIGFGHDQTELVQKEKEINHHVSSYKEVLETLSAGVAIYDQNQRLTYYNQAYCRMFAFNDEWLLQGPSLGEVLDYLRVRRVLPEQAEYKTYKQGVIDQLTNLMEPAETLNQLPDGRMIREILSPHPLGGGFYIFEDLSDRINLEQKYNIQLAVQRAALDSLFEGVAVFGQNHRLQFINSAFASIWNIDKHNLQPGVHLSEVAELAKPYISTDLDWIAYRDRVMSIVTDRIPKQRLITRTDGSTIEFSYIPLPDGSHMMSYHDVTDRINLQTAYEDRKQAQQNADRLKSDFISNMSYEMRSPLSTIIGYSDLLANSAETSLTETQKSYCRDIQVSSKRLLTLVNNILDLAMIESGHIQLTFETHNFWDLFQETIDRYNKQIDPDLPPIEMNLPQTETYILADRPYLIKTFETLLLNASSLYNQGQPTTIDIEETSDALSFSLMLETSDVGTDAMKGLSDNSIPGQTLGHALISHVLDLHHATFTEEQKGQQKIFTITLPMITSHDQGDETAPLKETG